MDTLREGQYREPAPDKNVRYIGYKLLQNVTFDGEPVVPQILSEGTDSRGNYTAVENVGGQDLADYLMETNVDPKIKFSVMKKVTGQLSTIDANGIVLFDRNTRNIRILNGRELPSVRQIDVEHFYDRQNQAVYSFDGESVYEERVSRYEKNKSDLWIPDVERLILAEMSIARADKNVNLFNLLKSSLYANSSSRAGEALKKHTQLLDTIISRLD